ncbi:MAG: glycosyltransferase family 4 protein [Ignavibacteriales bacterium]|nr:glycosyltransferase family 4 protein [Ignavibacteriales bacterium]
MNIVIATETSFPYGKASTNRIISYSRGFVELNNKVNVLCLQPTENTEKIILNKNISGYYRNIHFYYCCKTTLKPDNLLIKVWKYFLGILNGIIYLVKIRKQIDVIIMYSNSAVYLTTFFLLAKILRIKYIQEKSEYPFVLRKKSFLGKLYAKIYIKVIYKLFDGIFVMTKPLYEYFFPKVRKKAKVIIIPMTVESDRFIHHSSESKFDFEYMAYCGDMGGNKDGIDILLNSFKIISEKYDDINLVLIGSSSDNDYFNKLKEYVKTIQLDKRIIFTGNVVREEMPNYLCNAKILLLARPSSLQAQGGFPTKLGEYLSTGKPVVVTSVGEIPDYLTDNKNVFFSEPDSADKFAERVDFVLSNYELALKVGNAGKQVALNTFDYKVQSKRLLEFIKNI